MPYTAVLKIVPFAVFRDAIWSHIEWAQGLQFDLMSQVWHNIWCNPLLSTESMDVCRGWVSPQVRDGANQFALFEAILNGPKAFSLIWCRRCGTIYGVIPYCPRKVWTSAADECHLKCEMAPISLICIRRWGLRGAYSPAMPYRAHVRLRWT